MLNRIAPACTAVALGLLVSSSAVAAQSGAPAVTPANCKAPALPQTPSSTLSGDVLAGLSNQYQAAIKDGNARYSQCASDADWSKFQKSVEAYGNRLNAEVTAFNKASGRPQTTPASCTPIKTVDVPPSPTREQLQQIQTDLKTAQADLPRYAHCASNKDTLEAKTNLEKAVVAFNAKAHTVNAETQRLNDETEKANQEAAYKPQEEQGGLVARRENTKSSAPAPSTGNTGTNGYVGGGVQRY